MTQITEDYCSFETAKLLKEKGFDWCESPFYSEQDRGEWIQHNNYAIPNPAYNPDIPFDWESLPVVAPHVSLQMAMKWLREVHHCVICITPLTFHCDGIVSKWGYCIWADDNTEVDEDNTPEFDTYEDTCEAAIKYCLENLI